MRRAASLLPVVLLACAGSGVSIPEPSGRLVVLRLLPNGGIETPEGKAIPPAEALDWLRARVSAAREAGAEGLRVRCLLSPGLAEGAIDRFLDLCQNAGVGAVDLDF